MSLPYDLAGNDLIVNTISVGATVPGQKGSILSVPESLGDKLSRLASEADVHNGVDLAVMATPPTLASTTTHPSALTQVYGGSNAAVATQAYVIGGIQVQPFSLAFTSAIASVSGGTTNIGNGAYVSNGCALEFMTDAKKISICNSAAGTSSTFRVLVNDQYVSLTGTAFAAAGTCWNTIDFTSAGGNAVRKIRFETDASNNIYIGGVGGFQQQGIAVGPTESIWLPPTENRIKAIWYGASYVFGTGATYGANSFAGIASKLLGWDNPWQTSFGGIGYQATSGGTVPNFAQHIVDVTINSPDVVVLCGDGPYNDVNAPPNFTAALAAEPGAVTSLLKTIRGALPLVPIFVMGCFPGNSGPGTQQTQMEAAVLQGVNAFKDSRTFWVPIISDPNGSWMTGTGSTQAPSGTGNSDRYSNGNDAFHPNDAGHQYFGRQTARAIRNYYPLI